MIYFIGGPPKCGKTTLAKYLSKRIGVSWISGDTLQGIVRAYIPKEKHPEVFPHTAVRGTSNDLYYGANSIEDIVARYMKQAVATDNALKSISESYIANDEDVIIEGYQVHPTIVSFIANEYGSENIRSIFLMRTDIDKYVSDIPKSTLPNDWIVRKTKDSATYINIAEMVALYSAVIEKEAHQLHLPTIAMDFDFDKQIDVATSLLLSSQQSEEK